MKNSKSRRGNALSGFTLVELIVVIVVLGILAAIGIPRYNNYVNDSRLTHIKADMKTISSLIEVVAMDDDGVFRDSSFDDLSELEKAITEGRAYKEGNLLLPENNIGGDLHIIKDLFIKSNARSKLKGTFLVDENDEIYYIADKKLKGNSDIGDSGKLPDGCVLAKDEDFEWVDGSWDNAYVSNEVGTGYYEYIGSDECVKIPHEINGHPMTSYFNMFSKNENQVRKVISDNPNITNMTEMFYRMTSESLDLSNLDTSNTEIMQEMFMHSKIPIITGLTTWDTSKITNISDIFYSSHATKIDLSGWDVSRIKDMYEMFRYSRADIINLEGWITSSATDMGQMFADMNNGGEVVIKGLDMFDTTNVTNMAFMFESTTILRFDLRDWNTSNVTNMSSMFESTNAEEIIFSDKFDTSNVTSMNSMFYGLKALSLDLSFFDTSKVTDTDWIFGDSLIKTIYVKTSDDMNRFNTASENPEGLNFILGNP